MSKEDELIALVGVLRQFARHTYACDPTLPSAKADDLFCTCGASAALSTTPTAALEALTQRVRAEALDEAAQLAELVGTSWSSERVASWLRSVAARTSPKKKHDLCVSHHGPGCDEWQAECVCGWKSAVMPESDADRAAEAHNASPKKEGPR